MMYLEFFIPIIGIIFVGWLSGLSPYSHNQKMAIQFVILIVASIFSFASSDSYHEWFHFINKETLPSVALVLGICGILAFNFTIKANNRTSLFILLGIITPILSNLGTSLMVLPILIGSTPYLIKEYGKMRALLILLVVGMMAANTLAIFTDQADLPATAYGSDLKSQAEYTKGKSALEIFRSMGMVAYVGYLLILVSIGVKPRFNEIKKIKFSIENRSSALITIILCAFFILIMRINIWQLYLIAPLLAFILASIKYYFEYKRTKNKEKFVHSGANNVYELKSIYLETILLFFCIFSLIQCMPLESIGNNKVMIGIATVIETLFSDNLIAYQANKHIGYAVSWEFGTQWVLLSSILYGAHFVMGHVVLIFFFLNFLPKAWNKKQIKTQEEKMKLIESFRDEDYNKQEYAYEKIILKKFMLVSVSLLPITVSMQLSMNYGLWVIIPGIILSLFFVSKIKKYFV